VKDWGGDMKIRYFSAGLAIVMMGLLIGIEAPLFSRLVYAKSTVLEIPRKDFRVHSERVWQGDVVRLDVDVRGGNGDLYLLVDRVHFYIGTREERGAPTKILTTRIHEPSLITGSYSVTLTADLEGHLNIFFNNTLSPQPKTVTFTRVFERSTNVEYATLIIRNLSVLGGGLLLFIGLVMRSEEPERRFGSKTLRERFTFLERMTPRVTAIFLLLLALSTMGEAWYIVNQQSQIDQLKFRISSLQSQNAALSSSLSVLESNMSGVLGELESEISKMRLEYSQLENEHNNLKDEYDHLESNVEMLLDSKEELESQFGNYTANFKQLRNEVNSRLALDGNLSRFITPGDPALIERMLEITGGHENPQSLTELWEDYKALYDWTTASITYGADSPYPYLDTDPTSPVRWVEHSVRFPNETLSDGTGDCEDQAILLLSMMIAYNEPLAKWCISLQWEGGSHMAAAFPVKGRKLVILDPAVDYHTGTGSELSSKPVEEAIKDWISMWDSDSVFVRSVLNDKYYIVFDSTEEFLEWFHSTYE